MNPLDQLRDEIANLHLLADRLARKSAPSHDLVAAADAMREQAWKYRSELAVERAVNAYDTARSRHASGAQPDSACDEIGWLVEITGPRYWTGTPGCGNWTADSRAAMRFARRQDAEAACRHLAPSGAIPVEHAWVSHRPAGAQPSGAPAPASAQGDESAWLIERPGPLWWSGREGCGAWTTATDALRFARWEDADRMRRVMGFDDAKATEHIWCAPPSSEKTGPLPSGTTVVPSTESHAGVGLEPHAPGSSPAGVPSRLEGDTTTGPDVGGQQPASPVKPCPDVPFGSLGNDVEETLDALLGFGRSERMVERAQLRNEIAGLLSRRAPAPSPESEVVLDMPETDSGPLGRAQLEALHRLLAPVLDAAGFSPAHETAKKAIDRLLAQWRSGLEPRVPPCPATGESASPPSEQTAKELDELLAVFAKGDGDDEDCWTQPARRAQLYVASLRADLNDAQVQEFMHRSRGDVLAEINDGLRAEVERLRTALAEKEKAGVNANAVVERCIELVVRKKTPSWDEVSVWCDALRTALGAKEGT